MTKEQQKVIAELKKRSLFGIAQAAHDSWQNGSPYFCRYMCPFELRLKFAEANKEIFAVNVPRVAVEHYVPVK